MHSNIIAKMNLLDFRISLKSSDESIVRPRHISASSLIDFLVLVHDTTRLVLESAEEHCSQNDQNLNLANTEKSFNDYLKLHISWSVYSPNGKIGRTSSEDYMAKSFDGLYYKIATEVYKIIKVIDMGETRDFRSDIEHSTELYFDSSYRSLVDHISHHNTYDFVRSIVEITSWESYLERGDKYFKLLKRNKRI